MSEIWKGNQYAKGNKHWVGKKHKPDTIQKLKDLSNKNAILMYDLDGSLIQEFESIHEAFRITKINRKSISRCCRGLALTAGNHIWKFKT